MKKVNYFKLIVLILVTSIISLAFFKFDEGDDFELIKNLEIYHSVMKEVRLNYVDEVQSSELISYSISQMLKQLDPYTIYYPENLVEDYTFMNTGEFGGVGMTLENIKKKFIVTDILLDKPAYNSGIKIGDEVIKIENVDLVGKSLSEVSDLLKGETNSFVKIKIKNPQSEVNEYNIQRTEIESKNVTYSTVFDNNIGYIKLENFLANAGSEVKTSFQELNKDEKLKGLILDLRGNPGGLLLEAVRIVNIFVPKNTEIVRMKGKSLESNNIFYTTEEPVNVDIPIVVLIDAHSASASEIVAGSLQDLDRAVIVGQRSYGKGLVQLTKDLIYNTKMKITIAKYYIPSGRCIQAHPKVVRNKNMEIIYVPDSALTEFKTKNGRIVYDGAGIYPDVFIPQLLKNEFIDSLNNNFIFFLFANQYHSKNLTIDNVDKFKITDAIYTDFINYLEINFDFKSVLDSEIDVLEQKTNEDDYKALNSKILELKFDLAILKKSFVKDNDTEIKILIGKEIVKQYYYKEGTIEFDLYNGNEITKSLEIFNNLEYYNTLIK